MSEKVKQQFEDNCLWIREAGKHKLVSGLLFSIGAHPSPCPAHCLEVVGSQARILYSNEEGRIAVALSFNKAVAEGQLEVSHMTAM